VLGAVLASFAALQLNDPDALYWSGVYLLAAAFPLLAALPRRDGAPPPPLTRFPALRWGGWAAAGLFLLGFASLAGSIGKDWVHVEEAREALGYLICAGAVGFALLATRRRPSGRAVTRS
jgi:hypothetical protein